MNRSVIQPPVHGQRPTAHLAALAKAVAVGVRLAIATAASVGLASPAASAGGRTYNVRDYGAVGDGVTLDTAAIQKAIAACAAAGGGQVVLPPGRYLSGTVQLQSHITLVLEAGARLVGTTNLDAYQHPTPPAFMPEARWGKWHRGLLVTQGQEDIAIVGAGIIDGNRVFDPSGEERMRGPHAFVFVDCRNVTVRDVTFVDAANYAIFFAVSDQVTLRNLRFVGGWDGIHFRGAPERPCRDVSIVGCEFFTGDDAIAGRYWDGVLISGCVINSSCNGLRIIGPVRRLIVHDCLFYGPGQQPHRTSNRYNMLAGINLQPGAWDPTRGHTDEVLLSNLTMRRVSTALHCVLKPGNTAGTIQVNRLSATGLYHAAASVESWAEAPFTNVVLRDVSLEYTGGGRPAPSARPIKAPGVDARPLPVWGFYARQVQNLILDNVRLRLAEPDLRPVMLCDGVQQLSLDGFRFSPVAGVDPVVVVLTNVAHVQARDSDFLPTNR